MLLPYTTLTYYGPCAAAMYPDDSMGVGSMEATPHQTMRVAFVGVGTGDAPVLRPYRGYAAALVVDGIGSSAITPHQLMRVKLSVSIGAVPSAEDVAQAIWNSQSAQYNYPNTMGRALANASSGGVDYNALADAVWSKALESSLTAEQMLRIMAAALAGQRSGLGTATETYTGLDGATARIILTPDQNGNGTPAVNGAA